MAAPHPLSDYDSITQHLTLKVNLGEMSAEVYQRACERLADLMASGVVHLDYSTILEEATFPPIPRIVYHTAPQTLRTTIQREGLKMGNPTLTYGDGALGQTSGVYVGARPDVRGVWSREDVWDVWRVRTDDLPWSHDTLNPGPWRIDADVPRDRISIHSTGAHATGNPNDPNEEYLWMT